jgi:hypothetical protein
MGKPRYSGGQLSAPSDELLEKLRRLYNGSGLQRDVLGRRNALPSEIQNAIKRAGNTGR